MAEDHGKRLQTAENGCDSNDQCCDSYGHYCDSYGQCCDSYNIFILIDEGAKPREARRAFARGCRRVARVEGAGAEIETCAPPSQDPEQRE